LPDILMNIDPKKCYAVISGDFIGFSRLPLRNRQAMYFILKSGGKELSKAFPGIMPWEVDMFRGDGWQMLLTDPVLSLRAALYFKAFIRAEIPKKIDTRMAIAVGLIDYIPENRVSAGDGTAFRMSGKLLDKMSRSKFPTIRFIMEGRKASILLARAVQQAGALAVHWTPNQAKAIMTALKGMAHDQINADRSKSVASEAFSKVLSRAGWHQIQGWVSVFESRMAGSFSDRLV
jgi:hypothetical protein